MTPGARLAAAIEVMDAILGGARVEAALTDWGRRSRFAGSGDRRAVRDHIFEMMRCRRSFAALGGAETGRGIALGSLRATGVAPETVMTGEGHAPPPPGPDEAPRAMSEAEAADLPDWLWDRFLADWGDEAAGIAEALRHRAPVFVRVNLARIDRDGAIARLAADGIAADPVANIKTALKVTHNERKIATSEAYLDGLIELQDASSQAAVLALPLRPGDRVLDYCAGGGGKALAMAGLLPLDITAHDALPHRMKDLPPRAARAGCEIRLSTGAALAGQHFDLVLVDAPCSGSGTWRRDPEGKWRLTPDDLTRLNALQRDVLRKALGHVRPGGHLAYATCSILSCENKNIVTDLKADHPSLSVTLEARFLPGPEGDGFFLTVMHLAQTAT
jgi:16S rRNA (cytosine967-C5)-methyltransferase